MAKAKIKSPLKRVNPYSIPQEKYFNWAAGIRATDENHAVAQDILNIHEWLETSDGYKFALRDVDAGYETEMFLIFDYKGNELYLPTSGEKAFAIDGDNVVITVNSFNLDEINPEDRSIDVTVSINGQEIFSGLLYPYRPWQAPQGRYQVNDDLSFFDAMELPSHVYYAESTRASFAVKSNTGSPLIEFEVRENASSERTIYTTGDIIKIIAGDIEAIDYPNDGRSNITVLINDVEVFSGLVNVRDEISAGNYKLKLDHIGYSFNTPPLDLKATFDILSPNGSLSFTKQFMQGNITPVTLPNNRVVYIHIPKVAPAYTYGARWAECRIFSNTYTLYNDYPFSGNQRWNTTLTWKNRMGYGDDSTPDHLREMRFNRNAENLHIGESTEIAPLSKWRLKFVGTNESGDAIYKVYMQGTPLSMERTLTEGENLLLPCGIALEPETITATVSLHEDQSGMSCDITNKTITMKISRNQGSDVGVDRITLDEGRSVYAAPGLTFKIVEAPIGTSIILPPQYCSVDTSTVTPKVETSHGLLDLAKVYVFEGNETYRPETITARLTGEATCTLTGNGCSVNPSTVNATLSTGNPLEYIAWPKNVTITAETIGTPTCELNEKN